MTAELVSAINEVVWKDPERVSGESCFRGTPVPVQILLDHLEGNATLDEFLDGFPSVTREQAIQYMELANETLLACVSVSS